MMSDETAYILFPSDAPKQVPGWVEAQRTAAEQRLSRKPDAGSDAAAAMFPNEGKADVPPPAGDNDDPATTLFKEDAAKGAEFDGSVVEEFLNPYVRDAFSEGDKERGEALKAATSSLAEDFRASGASTETLKEAFEIVRESNDRLHPITPEEAQTGMAEGLSTLQSDLGSSFQSDLSAARAFINDLEIVAPGTKASLERNGAGNSLRLVKAAIKEAKRRGY
jgi:hypothetical protein